MCDNCGCFCSDSDNNGLMNVMLAFKSPRTGNEGSGSGPGTLYYLHHKNDLSIHASRADDDRFQLVVMEYEPVGVSTADRYKDMCVVRLFISGRVSARCCYCQCIVNICVCVCVI